MAAITEGHITLVRLDGQIWLVGGEEHLDLLLINQLPPDVTVELVDCATKAEMHALWEQRSSESTEGAQPWVLNPAITGRLLSGLGLEPGLVQFSPWSAALDEAAQNAVAGAAAWLAEGRGRVLLLRQFAVAAPAPGHSDLQRLRGQLVAAALARAGADPAGIREETGVAAKPSDAERLHIVMEAPG